MLLDACALGTETVADGRESLDAEDNWPCGRLKVGDVCAEAERRISVVVEVTSSVRAKCLKTVEKTFRDSSAWAESCWAVAGSS